MNYEELVESRKHIGAMTKEELYTYCQGLLDEVWNFEKENDKLHSIIKEVREYIYENSFDEERKEIIDELWVNEIKDILEILDKENNAV